MQHSPRNSFALRFFLPFATAVLLLLVLWCPLQARAAVPCQISNSDASKCGCQSRVRRDVSINSDNGKWMEVDDMVLPILSKTMADYDYLPGIDPRSIHLWPGGIVFYAFKGHFSAKYKALFKSALENIQTMVGTNHLEFREAVSKSGKICRKNYVQILSSSQKECKSMIGMHLDRVTELTLDETHCKYQYAIEHELLHSIGRLHEHQRRDREKYLDLKLQNLVSAHCQGLGVHSEGHTDDSDTLPYDYDSIMHYGSCAGTCNGNYVFVKKTDGKAIGINDKLSELDVKKLRLLYPAHQKVKYSSHFCTDNNGTAPVPVVPNEAKTPANHKLLPDEAKKNKGEQLIAAPSICLLLMAALSAAVVAL